MKTPLAAYRSLVNSGKLVFDSHQFKTVTLLQALHSQLSEYNPKAWSLFRKRAPQGVYLFGDVGSGKTMTMDLLYNTVEVPKRRAHWHEFMQSVHAQIHLLKLKRTSDPIAKIAQDIADTTWLLCCDELQVTDIADAMILRRLFQELMERNVVFVTTSNRHPNDLYINGIQRSSFIPTIELLKDKLLVHSLNSGIDYRKKKTDSCEVYFHPLTQSTEQRIQKIWQSMVRNQPVSEKTVKFLGRSLVIPEASGRIAKFRFQSLCGRPHSAADYLELVKHFDVLFLLCVPRMKLEDRDEARRFITLLDALYETKTKLIMSMDAPIEDLMTGTTIDIFTGREEQVSSEKLASHIFTGEEELFAFHRAVSRLTEMKSKEWVGEEICQIH